MEISSSEINSNEWDVIVIGGGPAGMMAAGRAAERGAKVLLIEKNDSLGKKLLITGGGRCNVTNAEFDNRKLLEKFRDNGKFLFSAFSQFSVKETLNFFHIKNMETKIEAVQRVFPISNSAQSVWNVMVEYLKKSGVTVVSNSAVNGFEINDKENKKIVSVQLNDGTHIYAKQFILATGGKSRPETGSTGDGFEWLKKIGHTVIESDAALVPIAIKDDWVKRLQGITLPQAKVTVFQNEIKQNISSGRILFTHFGISGPTILNISRDIAELLKYGNVEIKLDILSNLDPGQLNLKLQEILKEQSNKKIKNSLSGLVLATLVPVVLKLAEIDGETWSNIITREQRLQLVKILKAMPMQVEGMLGLDKAIITSGGVSLHEVDFKTMQSRLLPNLFLVGDILNIDRPSGGYSLQLCWTTGFVAGNAVNISSVI